MIMEAPISGDWQTHTPHDCKITTRRKTSPNGDLRWQWDSTLQRSSTVIAFVCNVSRRLLAERDVFKGSHRYFYWLTVRKKKKEYSSGYRY